MGSSPNPRSVHQLSVKKMLHRLGNYLEDSFCVLVNKVKASLSNLVKKLQLCVCLVFLGLVEGIRVCHSVRSLEEIPTSRPRKSKSKPGALGVCGGLLLPLQLISLLLFLLVEPIKASLLLHKEE